MGQCKSWNTRSYYKRSRETLGLEDFEKDKKQESLESKLITKENYMQMI